MRCAKTKSFTSNTCRKTEGGGWLWLTSNRSSVASLGWSPASCISSRPLERESKNSHLRYLEITGASATAAKPTTKNKNIRGMSLRALAGALANSFQTNTPQMAETMVAPCPMA